MAFAPVQHTGIVTSSNAYSLAYGSNVTAGNLLVVIAGNDSASGTITVPLANTGTAGAQTWNAALTTPFSWAAGRMLACFWAIASGTGSCTATMTWNGSIGDFYVLEMSGANPRLTAVAGVGAQGSGTSILLPSFSTPLNDNLVIGYASCVNQGTPQAPWTNMDGTFTDPVYWQANVAPGTYTPNVTMTSGAWANVMFALGLTPAALEPARDFASTSRFGPF